MDVDLERWIVEALADLGPGATPARVAEHVWRAHHEQVRAGGDLFFTWQVDLRDAAEAMATRGRLVVGADGTWSPATAGGGATHRGWSEAEVVVAVDGYLTLLLAEHAGEPAHRDRVVTDVAQRTGRTAGQVEQLFANVSAVVREHDITPLSAFPARSNVPVGVRPAVAAALAGVRDRRA